MHYETQWRKWAIGALSMKQINNSCSQVEGGLEGDDLYRIKLDKNSRLAITLKPLPDEVNGTDCG